MLGGGDPIQMSTDTESPPPLPINSRQPTVYDPLEINHAVQGSPRLKGDMQNVHQIPSIVKHSQKIQDELLESSLKIKHHEDNVKYLRRQSNILEETILDLQVAIGKYHPHLFKGEDEKSAHTHSEEEIIQHILKYEYSAAAILYRMRSQPEGQVSEHALPKDVVGVVATLGKVEDVKLSRLLSEYLGLDIMLAVVCRTYEGVKTLEAYGEDGSINKGLGIHTLAASMGKPLNDRFLVICLENLRPYVGEFIADDPQRRLHLLKPKLTSGETPPGFLGFAVNMVTIDHTHLSSKTVYNLRETLFYNLFLNLQVYRSREDMSKALPFITNGAISLDGGMIRNPGAFCLGHHRVDINVKFPSDSKRLDNHTSYSEIENQFKEAQWKRERVQEDMQIEQNLLDRARLKFKTKKHEFVQVLDEASHAAQAGYASTPN